MRAADPRLRAVVYRIVGGDVDDVLQTAYLRAFANWPRFRGRSTGATWLYRIAVNVALDHERARRRRDGLVSRLGAPAPATDVGTQVATALDLARAVDSLPADQRVVLLLVDGEGFTHDAAATVLEVPVGTIGSRLTRARQRVRAMLEGGRP